MMQPKVDEILVQIKRNGGPIDDEQACIKYLSEKEIARWQTIQEQCRYITKLEQQLAVAHDALRLIKDRASYGVGCADKWLISECNHGLQRGEKDE